MASRIKVILPGRRTGMQDDPIEQALFFAQTLAICSRGGVRYWRGGTGALREKRPAVTAEIRIQPASFRFPHPARAVRAHLDNKRVGEFTLDLGDVRDQENLREPGLLRAKCS